MSGDSYSSKPVILCACGATFYSKDGQQVYGGSAGAGKDSFGVALHRALNGKLRRVAFADHIKYLAATLDKKDCVLEKDNVIRDMVRSAFSLSENYFWNGKKDDFGRKLLQYLGTEVGRSLDPDYWIRSAQMMIAEKRFYPINEDERNNMILHARKLPEPESGEGIDVIYVSDTRFPNEPEQIEYFAHKEKFPLFLIAEIVRENYDNGLSEDKRNHLSEQRLTRVMDQPADYIVYNSRDLKELDLQAQDIARLIAVRKANILGQEHDVSDVFANESAEERAR